MRYALIIIAMLLVGCGDAPVMVSMHTETPDELTDRCGSDVGCAYWRDTLEGYISCDIYMRAYTLYPTDAVYMQTLGHELRHCLYGDWH